MDTVEQLRAAVHRNPRWVAESASRQLADAQLMGDMARLSQLLAVLGRARRSLGEIDLAESDLRSAIEASTGAPPEQQAELAADAHLGLAGVLSFAGRSQEAFTHLDTANRLGSERLRAYVALQRAVIQQRIGRMREALAGYRAALPVLRRLDANLDIAMVLLNRGVIRTQSGECEAAIADLAEAGRRFDTEAHEFGVAQADHGLGWAYARHGDLPQALARLDRAAARFQRLGHAALEVDVDRTEVLLAAGLFQPARQLAVETAGRLGVAGNHSQAAETWLLCARASALDGDPASAGSYAARAQELFARQGSVGWERAARLELALAESVARDTGSATTTGSGPTDAGLRALAGELADAGNARGAVTALALAAVAACDRGDPASAAQLSARSARLAARLGLFEVRTLATYARARAAAAGGDPATAARLVRAGLAGLRRHQTSLSATDARAGVAVHAGPLAALGLRLAWRRGTVPSLLEWIELTRDDPSRHASAKPPDDPALAREMAALRSVVAQVREREAADQDTGELLRAQRDLEQAIHRRQLRAAGGRETAPAVPGVRELARRLDGRCLVLLAEIGDRLVGARIGGGRHRLSDLGPAAELTTLAGSIARLLRRLLAAPRPGQDLDRLRSALAALDRAFAGLLAGDRSMVLVVPARLHAVPWRLLPCLTGRPVVVAPSASWWYEAQARPRQPVAPALVAIAGPRLVEAAAEATGAAGCYRDAMALTGADATSGATLAALARAHAVHIACHGRIRHDNPLWSSLELADGPLYVYDLERLGHTPPLVVLSGCETGTGVRTGDQLLGLSTAILRRGTRCLVAAVSTLPDTAATRDTMIDLHRRVAAGAVPSAALTELAAGAPEEPAGLVAASLGCFGAD